MLSFLCCASLGVPLRASFCQPHFCNGANRAGSVRMSPSCGKSDTMHNRPLFGWQRPLNGPLCQQQPWARHCNDRRKVRLEISDPLFNTPRTRNRVKSSTGTIQIAGKQRVVLHVLVLKEACLNGIQWKLPQAQRRTTQFDQTIKQTNKAACSSMSQECEEQTRQTFLFLYKMTRNAQHL